MATNPGYAPPVARSHPPIAIPLSGGAQWLIGTAIVSLVLYYFIGIDQGATSVFGNDFHIHEFVHDARHLLGFPCH
jgi:hypothetical protein